MMTNVVKRVMKTSSYQISLYAAAGLIILMIGAITKVTAQQTFKPGESVLASPTMLKDEKSYKTCTVVTFDAGSYSVNCDGTEYNVPAAYVRLGNKTTVPKVDATVVKVEVPATAAVKRGGFRIGDRVLASVNGLKGEKNYRRCTITGPLKAGAYPLRCDPFNGQPSMDFAVRPEWINIWDEPTPAPAVECPFNKDYPKASSKARPSPALFKSVIFEWQRSVSDFYDFGLTFLDFKMGRSFRNNAFSNGRRDVDTAPIGATIYEVKAKELICQKSSSITKRWIRDIGYACYKGTTGEWECKNGAPKYLEQSSIPNN